MESGVQGGRTRRIVLHAVFSPRNLLEATANGLTHYPHSKNNSPTQQMWEHVTEIDLDYAEILAEKTKPAER
ncbi:hypothetical protein NQZ68_015736 [Dissostichus eleginoides]|nr:hypothetical protein NQZ68_015736 [Dissostichus eleginoides]